MCPKYLQNKIKVVQNKSEKETRQKGNIYIARCKTMEEQKMLYYEGFKMYTES